MKIKVTLRQVFDDHSNYEIDLPPELLRFVAACAAMAGSSANPGLALSFEEQAKKLDLSTSEVFARDARGQSDALLAELGVGDD